MNKQGIVYLIGAGPGDIGLLTLRAKEVLEKAEVVVYDRLADPQLLAFAPAAEKIYVGKASSHHSMPQAEINKLLVKLAAEGKTVARLKGGDPLVFGRGGEEALELKKHKLPFVFVPGITSAIAVPEYAGIPVTHRQLATSFAVITGHEDPAKGTSSLKWAGLATAVDTLVFLMGVENIVTITKNLLAYGRAADTPAAFIRWGTKAEQETLVTTLGQAAQLAQTTQLKPPAIFLVGSVVTLRQDLNWFEKLPLFGKTIVVTRARTQASKLTRQLANLGAKVWEIPTIKILPLDDFTLLDKAISQLASYHWIIFTSVNGVESFFQRLKAKGLDSRSFAHAKLAAIGTATAAALLHEGLRADVIPATYKAEDLLAALKPYIQTGKKILLARAQKAREVLPQGLEALGAQVDTLAVYKTCPDCTSAPELSAALRQGSLDCITFTSSSTVNKLVNILGPDAALLNKTTLAAIGPITAATCQKHNLEVKITAQEYTIEGLVQALTAYYKE